MDDTTLSDFIATWRNFADIDWENDDRTRSAAEFNDVGEEFLSKLSDDIERGDSDILGPVESEDDTKSDSKPRQLVGLHQYFKSSWLESVEQRNLPYMYLTIAPNYYTRRTTGELKRFEDPEKLRQKAFLLFRFPTDGADTSNELLPKFNDGSTRLGRASRELHQELNDVFEDTLDVDDKRAHGLLGMTWKEAIHWTVRLGAWPLEAFEPSDERTPIRDISERWNHARHELVDYFKGEREFSGGYTLEEVVVDNFKTETENPVDTNASEQSFELERLLGRDPNLVLQGPPGTGKTYEAKKFVASRVNEHLDEGEEKLTEGNWRDELEEYQFSTLEDEIGELDSEAEQKEAWQDEPVVWEIVQLHPEYAYEDFVRGMATQGGEGIAFEPEDRTFVKMAEVARMRQEAADDGETKPTILILDEINRANLPSLLGELIYALEADKRGDKVRLQYEAPDDGDEAWLDSDDALAVPENLWVIGTMNTADRSIAMVDYAIRRRFRFMEMQPNDNGALQDYYEDTSRSGERVAEALEAINDAIDDSVRDRYGVGHSYLMVEPEKVDDWEQAIRDRLQYEVAPLLKEYALEGHLEAGMDRNDVVEEAKETLNLDSEAADE